MIKRLFFLAISLFLGMSAYSQNILADISKYDLDKIEDQTIKKTQKLLKTDKKYNLFVFTFYPVWLSDYFFQKTGTFDDSYTYFKLYDKEIGTVDNFLKNFQLMNKYRCYVYDNSLNIVAMNMENYVFPYCKITSDNMYIKYITELNPEYVFEYHRISCYCPMYFCYKDGEITVVHLSDDGNNIVSYPLSELKDWEWLNTGKLNGIE